MKKKLKSITARTNDEADAFSPSIRSLMGSFKAPADFDYKKILKDEKRRKFESKA
jgi:hypothetical protein